MEPAYLITAIVTMSGVVVYLFKRWEDQMNSQKTYFETELKSCKESLDTCLDENKECREDRETLHKRINTLEKELRGEA